MVVQLPQARNYGKYMITIGKFDIDDDNTVSYKYIPSITWTWIASLTHATPHIAKKMKKVTKRIICILDISSTE